MNKNFKIILGIIMLFALTSCMDKNIENVATSKVETTVSIEESTLETTTKESSTIANETSSNTLPAYTISDDFNNYVKAVIKETIDFNSQYYDNKNSIAIPAIKILKIDHSDLNDVKVFGIFRIYYYELRDGDTLFTVAGGSEAGLMHLKWDEKSFILTSFERQDSGSNGDESLREITKDYPGLYERFTQGDEMSKIRNYYIADYVYRNNLSNIKYYQDYGWEKQRLMNVRSEAKSFDEFLGTFKKTDEDTSLSEDDKIKIEKDNIDVQIENLISVNVKNFNFKDDRLSLDLTDENAEDFLSCDIIKHNDNIVLLITFTNIDSIYTGKFFTFY